MRFDIDVTLAYRIADEQVLLALEAAQTPVQRVISAQLEVAGGTVTRLAAEDGIGTWIWAHLPAGEMHLRYRATVEISRQEPALEGLQADPLDHLPAAVLSYLRPSRYCQSDLLGPFLESEFGPEFTALSGGAKIAHIRDWVGRVMTYRRGASHSGTSAMDTLESREGVCRDYAHLMITLARAADIPARIASVYAPGVSPPDFHAVAEVFLGGAWHLVDPTGMGSAKDIAIIGIGRDIGDVAFLTAFGALEMRGQSVSVRAAG